MRTMCVVLQESRLYNEHSLLEERMAYEAVYTYSAGWSSLVARRAHNPKVVGSNPAPATKIKSLTCENGQGFFIAGEFSDRKSLPLRPFWAQISSLPIRV